MDELWGGPYPLAVGASPPTQLKVWFNTFTNQLVVWNFATQAWQPVLPTVIVGVAPSSSALGQIWLDTNQKMWVHIDDWRELTTPVTSTSTAANGSKLTASFSPPHNPANKDLWFEPGRSHLFIFIGSVWSLIGTRAIQDIRYGNYANTWNAGGNRSQATAAGGILFLSGMRGIDPLTQQQLPGPGPQNTPGASPNGNARIDQIYQNIKVIAEAEGLTLYDCFGLDTYMTSAAYIGPTAARQAQPQFWGNGPYPCRTHIVMLQMSGGDIIPEFSIPDWPPRGDIVEVTALFSMAKVGRRNPTAESEATRAIPGVSVVAK